MGDHTVYTRPEGETTQWEDLQRKFGNLPQKDLVWKPTPFSPTSDEKLQYERLDHAEDPESLEDMQDDFAEDSFLETYRCLASLAQLDFSCDFLAGNFSKVCLHVRSAALCGCRQIRLAQLKEAANRRRYGIVSSIQRADFVREVTEASRECWVIVLLNQDKCGT